MENIVPSTNFSHNSLYNNSDMLFNSYYDSSYNDSDLLQFNTYHNSLYNSSDLILDFSHGFSDLFLENHDIYNETQIGDEVIEDYLKDHQVEEYDDSEYGIWI